MNTMPIAANRRFAMSASHIPPMPDPDPADPPGQDDVPGVPPEPVRDPERVPPLPVSARGERARFDEPSPNDERG